MNLPKIKIGNYSISRLIIGGNPICGYSHISEEVDEDMLNYFTVHQIKKVLFECEKWGITTAQMRGDPFVLRTLREYYNEGGKIQFIAQTASEETDVNANIRKILKVKPIGIYFHGTHADNLWHAGKYYEVKESLKVIRDCGVLVGLGTHIPEVIEYVDNEGWDVDFYMTCFYNLAKKPRKSMLVTGIREEDNFDDNDPPKMVSAIRQTSKPCLAFKILGAGRKCSSSAQVEEAFRYALTSIKTTDAVVVGMFPKYKNQIEENAKIVKKILS